MGSRLLRRLSAWLALLALLAPAAEAGVAVRVLIAEGKPSLGVASPGGLTITDTTGRRVVLQRAGGGAARLQRQRQAVFVREAGAALPVALVWPGHLPTVMLDGQAYRGRLEVHPLNGGLSVVNVVDLEDYLQGVIKDEIPPGWPTEAAKAMAIAARTYAVFSLRQSPGGLFHLRATTASQVYGGAGNEDPRTSWAVQATRGRILTFGGEPLPALYHSCSGGATEDGPDVFGVNFDMLVGVKDDFSRGCPHALWVERLWPAQIERALSQAGHRVSGLRDIRPLLRSRTGRVLRLAVEHQHGQLTLEGRRFREAVGNDTIRSTDFEVQADGRSFAFVGRGWGHGVGLSQWGAKEMADLAYQHPDILKFYYPLARLGTLP
ncbi:MAG: SpoIID/LytB domain-containing protein [Candidatus Methylomirabilales bacterium]